MMEYKSSIIDFQQDNIFNKIFYLTTSNKIQWNIWDSYSNKIEFELQSEEEKYYYGCCLENNKKLPDGIQTTIIYRSVYNENVFDIIKKIREYSEKDFKFQIEEYQLKIELKDNMGSYGFSQHCGSKNWFSTLCMYVDGLFDADVKKEIDSQESRLLQLKKISELMSYIEIENDGRD